MADRAGVAAEGAPLTGSQMQASLAGAKEARKRAELDAQLLANRIALLKQEEEKAWKKIEETRKRATEVTELRKQNQDKSEAKETFYKQKWESIRAAQAQNSESRDKSRAMRDQTRQGLMEQRHGNARNTKDQSKEILYQKKEREALERQTNQERSQYLKAQRDDAKRRAEEERFAQLDKFREDYEARTAQEELLRARTDALVAKMEKEEMELIQRLQNTQTVQRNAYEQLEAALGHTSQQMPSSAGRGAGTRCAPSPVFAGSAKAAPLGAQVPQPAA